MFSNNGLDARIAPQVPIEHLALEFLGVLDVDEEPAAGAGGVVPRSLPVSLSGGEKTVSKYGEVLFQLSIEQMPFSVPCLIHQVQRGLEQLLQRAFLAAGDGQSLLQPVLGLPGLRLEVSEPVKHAPHPPLLK